MITRRLLLKSALLLPAVQSVAALTAHARKEPDNAGAAQPTPWLEEVARQVQAEYNFPAVWLAANIEDKVEAAVVGARKYGDPTPATLNDSLMVGSISKAMAGVWIATLVAQGKLSYTTRVLDVLPELQASCLPQHRDINLGQLVTHTAGVIRDAKTFPTALSLGQYPAERLLQAQYILSRPGPPNTRGVEFYSNSGFTLAATMAEQVAGETYETAATRFYREKLGLKSWGVWPMTLPDDLTYPWPHAMNGTTPVPQPPSSVASHFVRPSGNAHCDIRDLVRFGLIGTNATQLARTVLSPEDWKVVMAPVTGTTAVLTSFQASAAGTAFSHNGSLGTTSSRLLAFPKRKVCFAFHTNAHTEEGTAGSVLKLVQEAFRKQRAAENP